jgi:hypothetical protein
MSRASENSAHICADGVEMKDTLWRREENPLRKKYLHTMQFTNAFATGRQRCGRKESRTSKMKCHPERSAIEA